MAPKRPPELLCDIHYTSIKGKKWIVLVGTLAGDPYEIFTGLSEDISLPSKCTKGKIVKSSRGQYHLHVDIGDEELIIKDIVGTFDNQENAWATRMISTALRHGTGVDFIVEQLSKDGGMGDVNKCLSRVLKKYIKDGMKVRTNTICEGVLKDGSKCGSENLIYSEGCSKCISCGFSKCS
jgi:ribonucleoside-diphosphate reductase alpha chain